MQSPQYQNCSKPHFEMSSILAKISFLNLFCPKCCLILQVPHFIFYVRSSLSCSLQDNILDCSHIICTTTHVAIIIHLLVYSWDALDCENKMITFVFGKQTSKLVVSLFLHVCGLLMAIQRERQTSFENRIKSWKHNAFFFNYLNENQYIWMKKIRKVVNLL